MFLKAHDEHIDARHSPQLPGQALESCGREPEQQGPERAQAHVGRALKDDEDVARVYDKTSGCCVNAERVFRFKGERIWEEQGGEYEARPADVYRHYGRPVQSVAFRRVLAQNFAHPPFLDAPHHLVHDSLQLNNDRKREENENYRRMIN